MSRKKQKIIKRQDSNSSDKDLLVKTANKIKKDDTIDLENTSKLSQMIGNQTKTSNQPFYKSWQFYTTITSNIIAIIAIVLSFTYFVKNVEKEMSNISCQMLIQPRSLKVEDKSYLYYQSWYMFTNNEPSTSKKMIISWFINNTNVELNSKAYIVGPTHGTEVEIVETTTPGYFEILVNDMPAGSSFTIEVDHRVKEKVGLEISQAWQKSMFSSNFTTYFISDINVSGEKANFTYDGIYELKNKKK